MNTRILHCSTSIENYNLCVDEKVAGFSNRGPEIGDLVYLSVKIENVSYCGARFILDQYTDFKPWPDADRYVNCFTVKDIEFCEPFDIAELYSIGGKWWGMKYLQASKPIKDKPASELLSRLFEENISTVFHRFKQNVPSDESVIETIETEEELATIMKEIPDIKIQIMGTFQTINFINETDKTKGLEALVNECFYSLFPQFEESRTVLIPENRLFKTEVKNRKELTFQESVQSRMGY